MDNGIGMSAPQETSLTSVSLTQIKISVLSGLASDRTRWDRFVTNHINGTVFHLSQWQETIASGFGHEACHLIAEDAHTSEILAILPLFLVRSLIFGRSLVSTPQAAYGGILASCAISSCAILEKAKTLAARKKVRFAELRNFQPDQAEPSLLTKDLYVTFQQELFADPEKNLAAIPRKTRAEVREGIRNQLEFRVDAITVKEFYNIYSASVRQLGTPVFPLRLFSMGMERFGKDCRIFSVHYNGKLAAAVWTLLYKDQVLPYYGGSLREFNRLAVNNFMYWKLMEWGSANGYHVFDFGRSKKGTGSFDFKKRWGMSMTDLPYQYFLLNSSAMPDTSPLNPKFSLAIKAWQRLPLNLTQWIGPMISKHLT
jgi:FemAB-related protein (PEP-CTERM system-associated)